MRTNLRYSRCDQDEEDYGDEEIDKQILIFGDGPLSGGAGGGNGGTVVIVTDHDESCGSPQDIRSDDDDGDGECI